MASNTPKNPKKELGNLIFSYGKVFFLDEFAPVEVTDEERRFYEVMTKAFGNQQNDSKEMQIFKEYIKVLILSIKQGYNKSVIEIFEASHKNGENSLGDAWKKVDEQLTKILTRVDGVEFLPLTMVGLSLLFMLRTSKRCLFIYLHQNKGTINQNGMYNALHDVLLYISNFLEGFAIKKVQIYLQEAYEVCKKLHNLLNRFRNSDMQRDISISNRLTKGIEVFDSTTIPNVFLKGTGTINLGEGKEIYNQLYRMCEYILKLQDKKDEELANIYTSLEELFPNGELYNKLLGLYETLSGAVRIITKVRRTSKIQQKGGRYSNMKLGQLAKYMEVYVDGLLNHSKHSNRRQYGGADNALELDRDYGIELLDDMKVVMIKGIPENMHNLYFNNPTYSLMATRNRGIFSYMFGPFYAVHDNYTSVDNILNESLNIHSVIKQFTNSTISSSMVLYTYGYSGSGKTFTLFGDIKKEIPDVENSTVLRIIKTLKDNGCKVSLDRTLKCYGTLSRSRYNKKTFVFEDSLQENEITGTMEEDTTWINKIKSELQHDKDPKTGLTKPNSFIKTTSNNPDSSRGFYILRFVITPPSSRETKVRHYLGIVDMAGNEDPFDIQSVMLPTLGLDKASRIFNEKEIFTNDIVYGELITTLQSIFHPLLWYIGNRKSNYILKPDDTLTNISYAYFDKLNEHFKQVINQWPTTTSKRSKQEYPKEQNLKIEELLDIEVNNNVASFKFQFSESLIIEILQKKIQSLQEDIIHENIKNIKIEEKIALIAKLNKHRHQQDYGDDNESDVIKALFKKFSMLDHATLDTIRNRLAQSKTYDSELKYMILSHVLHNQDKIHVTNKVFEANFDVFGENITNPNAFKNMIALELITFFAEQPYILKPINTSNAHTLYTIASIIKEGYYINQANAELMDYFTTKKNGNLVELPNNIRLNATSNDNKNQYDFEKTFSLSKYNKFKTYTSADAFVPRNNIYETQLVPTLRRLFTDGSKDIMFACLRDDKNIAIAKGAIDTLKLVQNIKST